MTDLERYTSDHARCRRADFIQLAIDKCGHTSYLEIGVNTGACFNKIQCKKKTGVDIKAKVQGVKETSSDRFFEENKERFDVIFIDGLHHADQVIKDIINAYDCLNEGGLIFVHDCNPPHPDCAVRERKPKDVKLGGAIWNGDVWIGYLKALADIKCEYLTVDADYGVGVIFKELAKQPLWRLPENWADFDKWRGEFLRLTTEHQYYKYIRSPYYRKTTKSQTHEF